MDDGLEIRPVRSIDIDRLLALNQAELLAVSSLDRPALERLVDMSSLVLVAEFGGRGRDPGQTEIAAFALVVGPGAGYESENYAWFSQRYADFAYLDRVVVAPEYRRRRLGSRLYSEVERRADAPWFCLEVNIEPRNDASLEFHDRLGFEPVGEQYTEGRSKKVVLFAKPLSIEAAANGAEEPRR